MIPNLLLGIKLIWNISMILKLKKFYNFKSKTISYKNKLKILNFTVYSTLSGTTWLATATADSPDSGE